MNPALVAFRRLKNQKMELLKFSIASPIYSYLLKYSFMTLCHYILSLYQLTQKNRIDCTFLRWPAKFSTDRERSLGRSVERSSVDQ